MCEDGVEGQFHHDNATNRRIRSTVISLSGISLAGQLTLSWEMHLNVGYNDNIFPCHGLEVRSVFKDVRADCYCASLLRTQIHMPRHASSARARY